VKPAIPDGVCDRLAQEIRRKLEPTTPGMILVTVVVAVAGRDSLEIVTGSVVHPSFDGNELIPAALREVSADWKGARIK
jgi:hypothetical protein